MKQTFLIILISFLLFSCGRSIYELQSLPFYFNHTNDFTDKMKILSEKSGLADPSKKTVCARTNIFVIPNTYVIPFVYSAVVSGSKDLREYSEDEINDMFYYFSRDIALKYMFFFEALSMNITAGIEEINKEIDDNNHGSSVFSDEYIYFESEKSIVIKKYKFDHLFKNINITENEIRDYYENNKTLGQIGKRAVVRQIYLSTKGLDESKMPVKYGKMESILTQLKNNIDFSSLAYKYSEDLGSTNNGGLLGDYVEKGEMTKDLEDIVFSLKPGDISGIVKSGDGYYIFKLDSMEKEHRESFGETKTEIKDILIRNQQNIIFEKELNWLVKKYDLKILK